MDFTFQYLKLLEYNTQYLQTKFTIGSRKMRTLYTYRKICADRDMAFYHVPIMYKTKVFD